MSEQPWRVAQLEGRVKELEDDVKALRSLRDQLIGMSSLAKWGIRVLIALGGFGALDAVLRVIQWLNAPIKPH